MGHEHKTIYAQPYETAEKKGEVELYNENDRLNRQCLKAIDAAISASNYEPNYYDLESAVKFVLAVYGAERVNLILAAIVRNCEHDGRYSPVNKSWAHGIKTPDRADLYPQTHPYILNGFIDRAREERKESVLERLGNPNKAPKHPKQEQNKAKDTRIKRKEGEAI